MIFHNNSGVEWGVISQWKDDPNLFHAFSTRKGGISGGNFSTLNLGYSTSDETSNVEENRSRFFQATGIPPDQTVMALQVHGTNVAVVDSPGIIEECDGLLTRQSSLYLIIGVADCHTIYLTDKDRSFVGALHSGWRGTAGNILQVAVEKSRSAFGSNSSDLEVGISPAIGGCCYEIGNEVAEQFPASFIEERDGSSYLSLDKAIAAQAREIGVSEENIYLAERCTSCEHEYWFSYRRDNGNTGRMWGVIGLR